MRLTPLAAVAAALAAAACTAQNPASPPPSSPPPAARSPYQMGIDLDFYWNPAQDVPALVSQEAAYARRLGANSVLISFPVYTDRRAVFAGKATPSPAVLAEAVTAVRSQGLAAGVRPLLDKANIRRSRVWFLPPSVPAWLTSYERLIVPYARAAQAAGATMFYTGAELSMFAHAPQWAQVTAAVRRVFTGRLYFSANWVTSADNQALPGSGGPGVTPAADAYPGTDDSITQFGAWWTAKTRELPPGTVLAEVGIAARDGAQQHPYSFTLSSLPLNPQVQAAWFTAACNAVASSHLGGIYFWSVYVGQPLNTPPTTRTSAQFTDSPGEAAIGACFTRLGGTR